MGLLLGADEQHHAATRGELAHERVCGFDSGERLLEVDDVNAVALTKDETLHCWVATLGLVSEMDSRLEHLAHTDDCHVILLPVVSGHDSLRRSDHRCANRGLRIV